MTDPVVTVHGDTENGFIVEVGDGDRTHVYTGHSDSADAASVDALQRFHSDVPMDDRAAPVSADVAHAHSLISALEARLHRVEKMLIGLVVQELPAELPVEPGEPTPVEPQTEDDDAASPESTWETSPNHINVTRHD